MTLADTDVGNDGVEALARGAKRLTHLDLGHALVDDDGVLLASGAPTGNDLPPLRERMKNFELVAGSKYERAATVFRWPDVYDPTYTKEETAS